MTFSPSVKLEQQRLQQSKQLGKGEEACYRIWQAQCSPYSHKVMTYMNYKGIPYKRITTNIQDLEWLKKIAGQSIVPVMLTPDEQVMQDSTPIMDYFENTFPEKRTIPQDNKLAFIMWLIEEFSDEYVPRMIMHTRWGNAQNRQTISHKIARNSLYGIPDMQVKDLAPVIEARQSTFDKHLGLVSEEAKASMDKQIRDLLAILEQHFEHYQFLLGLKPSLADFALYGPLKIHFYDDPQSNQIMESLAPRTCNWLHTIMEFGDTRGGAGQTEFGEWLNLNDGTPESLKALLKFIARTYIPFCSSAAEASREKQKTYDATIYGVRATFSTHQYRAWSFEQLQEKYLALSKAEKDELAPLLTSTEVIPDLMANGVIHNNLFDGFTPPFVVDGVPDARIKYLKENGKKVKQV